MLFVGMAVLSLDPYHETNFLVFQILSFRGRYLMTSELRMEELKDFVMKVHKN